MFKKKVNRDGLFFIATIFLCLLFFLTDILLPLGFAGGIPYTFVILLSIQIPSKKSSWVLGGISSLFIVLGYFLSESSGELWVDLLHRSFATICLWAAVFFVSWHKTQFITAFQKESMFRILFQSAIESIIVVDSEGRIKEINKVAESLFGYDQEELVGAKIEQLVPQEKREKHQAHRDKYTTSSERLKMGQNLDVYALKKDGSTFPVEISLSSFQNGDETYVMVLVSDITERKQLETRLRRNERKYRSLFETMAQGVVYQNADGIITSANPASEKILGLTLDQMTGKTNFVSRCMAIRTDGSYIPPEEHPSMLALRTGKEVKNQIIGVFHPKTKDYVWINVHATPQFLNGEKKSYQVYTIFEDITKRLKSENDLKKSERNYRALFEETVQGVLIIDPVFNIVSANPAAHRIMGMEGEDMTGKSFFDSTWKLINMDESDFPVEDSPVVRSLETGNAVINKKAGIRNEKTGNLVWISISTFPLFENGTEKPFQVIVTLEDITQRTLANRKLDALNNELEKRVEERSKALKESQEMYKLIARNFPNGVINVLDEDLNYVFSEGMELYKHGITSENLIGTSFLDRLPFDVRDEIKTQLFTVFSGQGAKFELTTAGRTYMIYAVEMKHNDENQILMVSQNITDLKNAEKQIQQALEKEKHLNELKSRFVSIASHEFRTPLTSATNSLNLLSKYISGSKYEEKQKKQVRRMRSAIEHLTYTLDDFLSLDKLEEGKVVVHNSPMNILTFMEESIEDMEGQKKVEQRIVHTHTGSTDINMDKTLLRHICNNLLSNALKYSGEGSIVDVITIVDNNMLTLSVKDQGIGIPQEEQIYLFQRFFRAQNATEIQGTGLGLNIIKKYIDLINGEIKFTSKLNKGTTFTVLLPLNPCSKNNYHLN